MGFNTDIISATTISGTTFYGDGSNLTGVSGGGETFTGGTYSAGTLTLTNNTGGTIDVSGFYTGLTEPFPGSFSLIGSSFLTNSANNGSVRYISPLLTLGVTNTELARSLVIPATLTIGKFYVLTGGVQPSSGSHVLTIRKNGVSTNISITIPADSASGVFSDLVNTEVFEGGDLFSIEVVNNASSSAAVIYSISVTNV
jgi:hypothetical protein